MEDDNCGPERISNLAGGGHFYKPSCVPAKDEMDLRELTRIRLDLRYGATGHKNHVRAILDKYPLKRPAGLYPIKGREWLRMAPVRDYDRMVLDAHLTVLNVVVRRISLLEKEIYRLAVSDPRALLLMTVPGVGPVTTVTILTEIGEDLTRFTGPEKLTTYADLVPFHRSGADTARTGGIAKR